MNSFPLYLFIADCRFGQIIHIAVVAQHGIYNAVQHILQFVNKDFGFVLSTFNIAKFLFPTTCKFGTFQQVVSYDAHKLYTRWGCHNVFLFTAYIVTFEERLDYCCASRWATYAVLLHCIAQFLVIYQFAGRRTFPPTAYLPSTIVRSITLATSACSMFRVGQSVFMMNPWGGNGLPG